jgi:hypothetical protein
MTRTDFDALLHRQPLLCYEIARVLSMRLTNVAAATIQDLREKNRQLALSYVLLRKCAGTAYVRYTICNDPTAVS